MNERKKKSRRWFSFSLRTALVLLTCFGIWLGWFVPRVQKQKRAVEWIRSFERQPYYSFQFNTAGFFTNGSPDVPQWLTSTFGIDCFYSIQMIHLDDRPVGDISPVASLHYLRHFELTTGGISDLTPLQNLSRLEHLSVSQNPIDDISALARLKNLKRFYAFNTKIHDLEPLRSLPALENVALFRTEITDLSPLADHRKLAVLNISETNVSDIAPLRTCTALVDLDLSRTKVPAADIDALQELLPNCKITR